VWRGKYAYPRSFLTRNSISVARRTSVAVLDEIVGPKTYAAA
jgi:hypothetical protein